VLIDNHLPLDNGTFEGIQDKTAYVKFAIMMKNINLLELLLTKNAPLEDFEVLNKACYFKNHSLEYYPFPPIFFAIHESENADDLKMIEILLRYGAKLNFQDQVNLPHDTLSKLNIVLYLIRTLNYNLEDLSLLINLFCKYGLKINYDKSDAQYKILTHHGVMETYTSTTTFLRGMIEYYENNNAWDMAEMISGYVDFLEYKTKSNLKSLMDISRIVVRDSIVTDTVNMLTQIDTLNYPTPLKNYLKCYDLYFDEFVSLAI
jgi:hypothetical protein